jgi:hypothetical protein
MKTASGWMVSGGDGSPVKVDANGYPLGMPAGADNIYIMVGMDPVSVGTDNTYVLTYSGTANFLMLGGKILSKEPGRITFQYLEDVNRMPVQVTGLDARFPLTDIHIVRRDQEALYKAGEIFNPAFTSKIASFDTLRYMDWSATNVTRVVDWGDRTKTSAMSWQNESGGTVPIEVMVALANKTKTNMWLNIPTQANDDYVRQMITYVRDHLDPGLNVKLEYSNEVWNWSQYPAHYAQSQGAKLFDIDADGDGKIDGNAAANFATYYGYRAAQVAGIANSVFGTGSDRLTNILSTQTAYLGIEGYIFDGIARAKVGDVSDLFKAYAITTYFENLHGGTANDRAAVLSWARSGEAGLTAAFKAMTDGTGIETPGSLKGMQRIYAYQAAVAAKYGLNLVAYEGGPGMTSYDYAPDDQPTVLAFFARMQADPRMGDLLRGMVADFSAAGGTLSTVFNDAGPDSVHGTWGQLKSIYDKGSPAWDALVAMQQAEKGSEIPGPTPTPEPSPAPTGVTDKANYPMAAEERSIA